MLIRSINSHPPVRPFRKNNGVLERKRTYPRENLHGQLLKLSHGNTSESGGQKYFPNSPHPDVDNCYTFSIFRRDLFLNYFK